MPAKSYKVGDKIQVSMHGGKIVEAVIKAIIDSHRLRCVPLHWVIAHRDSCQALRAHH
jgi:hypothetical protein